MSSDDIAELRRIVAPATEPTALRLFTGDVEGNSTAMLHTWRDGTAELTIRAGETTHEQLKAIRWALDQLEAKLTTEGGYYHRSLRLVGGEL
jgi:hypothetical protein